MSWFSNLLFGKDPGQSDAERQLAAAGKQRGAQSDALESDYLDKAQSFDPSAALNKYAEGAYGNFSTQLKQQLGDLAGKSVGAGRLDTGFFDQDQGKVMTDLGTNFINDLNTHALDAAHMEQAGISELGQHSLAKSSEYLDLVSGEADRETAKQNAKRQQRSDFTGGLMKLAGTFLA